MIQHFQRFILLFFVFAFFSCAEQERHNSSFYVNTESVSKETNTDPNFIVGDSSKYAQIFLDSLKLSGYATTYKINSDTLILNQTDTVFFPVKLNLGETKEFVGAQGERHYFLMLRQINYTTIRFGLVIFENSEVVEKVSGDVNLLPLFFLGADSDEDDVSGVAYLATEYVNSSRDCEFSLRLGKDESSELLVKIKRRCNDSRKNIELRESPTFRKTKNAS